MRQAEIASQLKWSWDLQGMGSLFHSVLPQDLTRIKYIWQMTCEILAEEVLLIRDKEVWDSVEVPKQAELCRCAWGAGCGFTITWLLWQKGILLLVLQQDSEPFLTGICFYKHLTRVFGISSIYSRWGCASLSCCKAIQSTICQKSLLNSTCYSGPSHSLVSSETLQEKHRVCSTTLHRDLQSRLQAAWSLSPCVVGGPSVPGREMLPLAHQTHRGN